MGGKAGRLAWPDETGDVTMKLNRAKGAIPLSASAWADLGMRVGSGVVLALDRRQETARQGA
jgi:hypothetical protein